MLITDLVYIDTTGYHFSDYPAFLSWLQDSYKAIYGADVYLEADSQDGQFLAVLAKAFYDTAALGSSVYNSFSPATAQGVGLSRNVLINGLKRHIASKSSVDLVLVGQADTVIDGGVAQDILNQKWDIPLTTIPIGGSITVPCFAQEVGAIIAEPNTITKIFTPTLGWQTVNNPSAAIPGAPIETDAELRVRQSNSTADPSLTVFDGTIGGVSNLTGVTKVRGYENDTGTTDGNGLPPHSICVIAAGGDDVAIANEIALHKTPGAATFGTSSETVYDAHGMPLLIKFSRPTIVTIKAQIVVTSGQGWSNDFVPLIQAAVAAAINKPNIGEPVIYNKLFAPAYLGGTPQAGTYEVDTLEIAKDAGPLGTTNIILDFDEEAVCSATLDITVIVT